MVFSGFPIGKKNLHYKYRIEGTSFLVQSSIDSGSTSNNGKFICFLVENSDWSENSMEFAFVKVITIFQPITIFEEKNKQIFPRSVQTQNRCNSVNKFDKSFKEINIFSLILSMINLNILKFVFWVMLFFM